MDKKMEKQGSKEKDVVLRGVLIVAGILVLAAGIIVTVRLLNPKVDTKAGIKKLAEMEKTDVSEVDKQIQMLEEEERKNDPDLQNRSVEEKFSNCLIMGDSITKSLYGYHVLDQSLVLAEFGAGVAGGKNNIIEKHIARAVELKPKKLFLAYGLNDADMCGDNIELFREKYDAVIDELKSKLPDTEIYVNSVLPAQQKAINKQPAYGLLSDYDAAVRKMCEEKEVTYIDILDLAEAELYEPDGIHMKAAYYPKWLERMAEVAKL